MRTYKLFILCIAVSTFSQNLMAEMQIRATELTGKKVSEILTSNNQTYIVEFKSGDQIPINFEAEGDLFDSKNNINNILNIKKDFLLKIENNTVLISLDGQNFESLKDALEGSFSANADLDPSQIPALIKVMLSVYLK